MIAMEKKNPSALVIQMEKFSTTDLKKQNMRKLQSFISHITQLLFLQNTTELQNPDD